MNIENLMKAYKILLDAPDDRWTLKLWGFRQKTKCGTLYCAMGFLMAAGLLQARNEFSYRASYQETKDFFEFPGKVFPAHDGSGLDDGDDDFFSAWWSLFGCFGAGKYDAELIDYTPVDQKDCDETLSKVATEKIVALYRFNRAMGIPPDLAEKFARAHQAPDDATVGLGMEKSGVIPV